ncbi:histidine--tRNA ligase [Alkalihalobacillus sp. LMS6]|uniref:histidine--tRNA ligase n=1 Tax=Alkalihalobacillus sp. LMS6 TaxID=2924034 RepID=UPI0020D01298|nr:histidine--tRNA ligase [Alkalihalobacillus sp. LMS6]UTR07004.1 histidine--tRNA ligase [Alkalihalobacillus sp. LMS6]
MKKMDYQNVRGTQDYLPNEEVVRLKIRRTLEDVFIQFGCKPLETPILNYTELMASKYGGGAEILEEMYTLTDRGKRDLALRYDLTMPFAKVMALNPTLPMPLKRYEIGKVFRDGPIKAGRFREFTQCDVDIAGVDSQVAEAECMLIASEVFKRLDLKVEVQYNNRTLLTGLLTVCGVEADKMNRAVLTLDKLKKNGVQAVLAELGEQGLADETIAAIERFLQDKENDSFDYVESFAEQNEDIKQGLRELMSFATYLEDFGLDQVCVFNPFLARGLDIYTSTVYELFLTDQSITSSIGSGGRYDQAIGGLLGTDEKVSTVGISFGLDVIYSAMKGQGRQVDSTNHYYVVPLNKEKEAFFVAGDLRSKGNNVEVELGNKKVSKALTKANRENYRYVVLIGEDEVRNNQYKIKDMKSGEETVVAFQF